MNEENISVMDQYWVTRFAKFGLVVSLYIGLAALNTCEAAPPKFTCFEPIRMEPQEISERIANAVGMVVLYHSKKWFEDVETCLFNWYVSDHFVLASFAWDTHHALLRMMSADPEQFFGVVEKYHPAGYKVWRDTLDHAQLWRMDDKCPDPSPLQQAARSIDGYKFNNTEKEKLRLEVLGKLRALRCEVPE